jgi:hypothetical protein
VIRRLLRKLGVTFCTCDGGKAGAIDYGHAPWCERSEAQRRWEARH